MNRKRLLTILAGATAALALQVGPAAALVDVDADVSTDDGLEAEVEVGDDSVKLDPEVEGDSSDEDGDSGSDTTKKAEDTTRETIEKVEASVSGATGGGGDDSSSTESSRSGGSTSGGSSSSGSSSSGSSSSDGDEVTTAGDARGIERLTQAAPNEAVQRLSGYDFAAASQAPGRAGMSGDVSRAFDLTDLDGDVDVDDPLVAAPGSGFTSPLSGAGDDVPAPESAPPAPEQAELATAPTTTDDGGAVPAALKLLAASLVAGTGAIWHVARREVGLR